MSRGRFITLEGIDGAGKSTHLAGIADFLRERGKEVVVTREPGGTPLGESLRALLLSQPMSVETETLMIFAARREHIARVIAPALSAGRWVLSDRFTDATYAYQGAGRGMAEDKIAALERWVQEGLQPDLTLLFDVPVEIARQRLAQSPADRFEGEGAGFFERIRSGYLKRAAADASRIRVIDSEKPLGQVKEEVEKLITVLC